jgi:CubicO group peptidase (beta-lactamase class C family)
MRKLLLTLLLVVSLPATAQQLYCDRPAELGDGWSYAMPSAVGIDSRVCGIDKFLDQWPDRNIHAVVVARRGKLVMERYFTGLDERWGSPLGRVVYTPEQMHDLRSISKTVVSLLVGLAIGDGKFPALDTSAIDHFPALASQRTADNARITFRHLLTMSSGIAWNEALPSSNPGNSEHRLIATESPLRHFFEQSFASRPGELYNYNGGNTHVLGAAVAQATNVRLAEYAREKLYQPLGITVSDWVYMPNGEIAAASGARLRPRDTAKLGQIMLTGGVWNGRQVLPKGWAAESVKPRITGPGFDYGYHWRLGISLHAGREQRWFAGFGDGGQRLFIVPGLDLVVVINAGHYGQQLQSVIPTAILNDLVLPAVRD